MCSYLFIFYSFCFTIIIIISFLYHSVRFLSPFYSYFLSIFFPLHVLPPPKFILSVLLSFSSLNLSPFFLFISSLSPLCSIPSSLSLYIRLLLSISLYFHSPCVSFFIHLFILFFPFFLLLQSSFLSFLPFHFPYIFLLLLPFLPSLFSPLPSLLRSPSISPSFLYLLTFPPFIISPFFPFSSFSFPLICYFFPLFPSPSIYFIILHGKLISMTTMTIIGMYVYDDDNNK